MSLELQGEFLGLGSMVRLETEVASGLFVVLARGAFRPDAELAQVEPRYLVAPHPYGEAPDQETFPVLARDVQEVVFRGYVDSDDEAFLEDLLDQMENGRRATTPAQQYKEPLTAIPEGSREADDGGAGEEQFDPFAELRKLTGQTDRKDER